MNSMTASSASWRDRLLQVLIPLLFFTVTAPQLAWLEFSSGSENLNVATALEIRRTGNWWMPTLQGQPRVAKPPLTAWITAAAIEAETLSMIDSADPAVRAAGYRELAWETRWPALLASCLLLFFVYELARIFGGTRLAIAATLICGTTYGFLRFGRASTTDVQLALWVTAATVLLLKAILEEKIWLGCVGGAAALALAFLSKGPVALVQTVLPLGVFLFWRIRAEQRVLGERSRFVYRPGGLAMASLAGLGVFLLLTLPWFLSVAIQFDVWGTWSREVFRKDATALEPDPFYNYINLFGMVLPWIVFFIGGLILAIQSFGRSSTLEEHRRRSGTIASFLLLIVPIIVMSFFSDKPMRYLLPMIGPASVLIGQSWVMYIDAAGRWKPEERLGGIAHWIIIAVTAVGFPLFGATKWIEPETQRPWFAWTFALPIAAAGAMVVLGAILVHRRRPESILYATVLVMLIVGAAFTKGYAGSLNGSSEMRPMAQALRERFADADVRSYRPGRRAPEDLSIYLNQSVVPVETEEAVRGLPAGTVLMVYQRKDYPMPELPGRWRIVETALRGKNHWHAMVRE